MWTVRSCVEHLVIYNDVLAVVWVEVLRCLQRDESCLGPPRDY